MYTNEDYGNGLKLCYVEPLDPSCHALQDHPCSLQKSEGGEEWVCPTFNLDILFCDGREVYTPRVQKPGEGVN